jgi:DNA-binding GntR family transcriptional regulator
MEIETFDNLVTRRSFRPQESLSIGAQLHRILRAAIIRGELVPGQAISEIEMSKKFSISRQPVREAFIKLGEERLIEVLPQRGTYIRKISVKEVSGCPPSARDHRSVDRARSRREKHDAELIKTLRSLIAAQRKVKQGDNQSYLLLDEEFHRALALHAGREYMWRITEGIKAQMNRVRFLTFDSATPMPQLTDEHSGSRRRHRSRRRRSGRAAHGAASARAAYLAASDGGTLSGAFRRRIGDPPPIRRQIDEMPDARAGQLILKKRSVIQLFFA